jgi:AcrR family transcriptional regulator
MTIAPRNSRQATKIEHAAAQLFARQGYHGTSTREIARIADISENTLFRHFEHKEDLFWAALRSRLDALELRRGLLDGMARSAVPEEVLPLILAQLVDTSILMPELLPLVAVAFIELPWKAAAFCREHLSPIFSAINSYLAANIEKGRLRNLDPSLITAALASMAMIPEFSKLVSDAPPPFSDTREAIRVYTRFWLEVLTPPIDPARTAMLAIEPASDSATDSTRPPHAGP